MVVVQSQWTTSLILELFGLYYIYSHLTCCIKQYQLQVRLDLSSGNVVSQTVYKSLIKASWILSDVITKHPQLNLLEAAIRYDVQALAEVCICRSLVIDAFTQLPDLAT